MNPRYTSKHLESDLAKLNNKLAELSHPFRFVASYRNGYMAVDLATVAQAESHTGQRNLVCGTPSECLAACYEYIVENCI